MDIEEPFHISAICPIPSFSTMGEWRTYMSKRRMLTSGLFHNGYLLPEHRDNSALIQRLGDHDFVYGSLNAMPVPAPAPSVEPIQNEPEDKETSPQEETVISSFETLKIVNPSEESNERTIAEPSSCIGISVEPVPVTNQDSDPAPTRTIIKPRSRGKGRTTKPAVVFRDSAPRRASPPREPDSWITVTTHRGRQKTARKDRFNHNAEVIRLEKL